MFEHLKKIKPIATAKIDPRLHDITVRQCLNHSGGWDRAVRGDAINWEPYICRAMNVRPPVTQLQFTSFTMGVPLDFAPGTNAIYSNIGYILLGEAIARVSGQTYERFVLEHVLKPMGIARLALHKPDGRYLVAESLRYLAGSLIALPALLLPMVNAAGGWSASVVDMARFLTNLDGSRGESVLTEKSRKAMIEAPPQPLKPRENGTYFGLGWDAVAVKDGQYSYFKDGSCQGMRHVYEAAAERRQLGTALQRQHGVRSAGHADRVGNRSRSSQADREFREVSGHRLVRGLRLIDCNFLFPR